MPSLKECLYNTKIPTIKVCKYELGTSYLEIGSGDEGSVYNYNDKYAIKIFSLFRALDYFYGEALKRKFQKIEQMSSLKDEAFCFPLGLVGFETEIKEGCYTNLVKRHQELESFKALLSLHDKNKVLEYILKADSAMKRIHTKDIIIGDVKMDNILIDVNNNIKFIDTDNYAYQDFGFDLHPARADALINKYGKCSSLKDNDIFVFSMMALNILTEDEFYGLSKTADDLKVLIKELNVDKETKEGLNIIFSDSEDKPYFSEVFRKIEPNQKLITNY